VADCVSWRSDPDRESEGLVTAQDIAVLLLKGLLSGATGVADVAAQCCAKAKKYLSSGHKDLHSEPVLVSRAVQRVQTTRDYLKKVADTYDLTDCTEVVADNSREVPNNRRTLDDQLVTKSPLKPSSLSVSTPSSVQTALEEDRWGSLSEQSHAKHVHVKKEGAGIGYIFDLENVPADESTDEEFEEATATTGDGEEDEECVRFRARTRIAPVKTWWAGSFGATPESPYVNRPNDVMEGRHENTESGVTTRQPSTPVPEEVSVKDRVAQNFKTIVVRYKQSPGPSSSAAKRQRR